KKATVKAVDFVGIARVESPAQIEARVFVREKAELVEATVATEKVGTGEVFVRVEKKVTVKAVDFVGIAKVENPVPREAFVSEKADLVEATAETEKVGTGEAFVRVEKKATVKAVDFEGIERVEATVGIGKLVTEKVFVLIEIGTAFRIKMKILETERVEMKDPPILSPDREEQVFLKGRKALAIEKGERVTVFKEIRRLPKRKLYYEKMPENGLKTWSKMKKRPCSRIWKKRNLLF
ncbi:MAG: hypothetical protein EBX37_18545, partial [Alphaproteobacteria bacterium]|nr:hypothetical protein [Alphaproteobacteria bacterium]